MTTFSAGETLTAAKLNLLDTRIYRAEASAVLGLTTTVTDVTGASVVVSALAANAKYVCTAVFDCQSIGTTATTALGILDIDGVDQSEQAIFNQVSANGLRSTIVQTWEGTLSAGSHTFKLQGQRTGGADSMLRFNALHTTITVAVVG